MRIYSMKNVYDAAIERLNYLFDEFENIVVNVSGGKDSTVVFNLAMEVAKKKNKLPLDVLFIDQEAEHDFTIDIIKEIMYRKDVKPYWMQFPFRIENAVSFGEDFLNVWGEGEEWLREKDPISYKKNIYNNTQWEGLFTSIMAVEFKGKRCAGISGIRTEESPTRFMGLTEHATYKWITWGRVEDKKKDHYAFYPIYDWSYTDVWKAIHDNHWTYNKLYDYQYQYGTPLQDMRVSSLHHQTAIRALFYLQEIEPELYNKMTKRLTGIDSAGKFGFDDFFPKQLPYMFRSWVEYRDFLFERLIKGKGIMYRTNIDYETDLKSKIDKMDKIFAGDNKMMEMGARVAVRSLLNIDIVKIHNFISHTGELYKRDKKKAILKENIIKNSLTNNGKTI